MQIQHVVPFLQSAINWVDNTGMDKSDPSLEMTARHTLIEMFLEATALGDALGATTEFYDVERAKDLTLSLKPSGFPFKPIGGGWLRLPPGAHTDDTDMALAMASAFVEAGDQFEPVRIMKHWTRWLASLPPDVGMLTRQALSGDISNPDVYTTSRELFLHNPQRAPNGALMRNAVVCAMAPDLATAFAWSLKQGILTHYHPQSVLCCAIQVWLIWETFEERWPFQEYTDWLEIFHGAWTHWIMACEDLDIKRWLNDVSHHQYLDHSMDTVCDAEFDPDSFNPFRDICSDTQGWVVISLQVAIWAMQWCRRRAKDYVFNAETEGAELDPIFSRRGHDVIGWIPLIGRDADTYGAIAGPMIAAGIGRRFPKRMTKRLKINENLLFLDT